ncbi:alpha/beta fold hydrolase [Nocardia tengchongensis]|uniref:alpha/beta fold hydrolase n=1 Tax=Nocardia tengchongensis TaxID=2055889 RepID=UPI003690C3B6
MFVPTFFPPIDPYADGLLQVGEGNQMYWCASGNPVGRPVLVVHGGPGSGSSARARKSFDPNLFRIVQFDQRGCGRSIPNAADPSTDMTVNTTEHLIADMERLRIHLGIDRWLLYGGSWGSTLILAYAQRYPQRVTGIVLVGVTTTRRREIDWLYRVSRGCGLPNGRGSELRSPATATWSRATGGYSNTRIPRFAAAPRSSGVAGRTRSSHTNPRAVQGNTAPCPTPPCSPSSGSAPTTSRTRRGSTKGCCCAKPGGWRGFPAN